MVLAMSLGMVFYAGFIADQNDMTEIAEQLYRLVAHGLLDRQRSGHSLTMAPVAPVTG
jgi:hypothetical protein